jgi:hypothetical protein
VLNVGIVSKLSTIFVALLLLHASIAQANDDEGSGLTPRQFDSALKMGREFVKGDRKRLNQLFLSLDGRDDRVSLLTHLLDEARFIQSPQQLITLSQAIDISSNLLEQENFCEPWTAYNLRLLMGGPQLVSLSPAAAAAGGVIPLAIERASAREMTFLNRAKQISTDAHPSSGSWTAEDFEGFALRCRQAIIILQADLKDLKSKSILETPKLIDINNDGFTERFVDPFLNVK